MLLSDRQAAASCRSFPGRHENPRHLDAGFTRPIWFWRTATGNSVDGRRQFPTDVMTASLKRPEGLRCGLPGQASELFDFSLVHAPPSPSSDSPATHPPLVCAPEGSRSTTHRLAKTAHPMTQIRDGLTRTCRSARTDPGLVTAVEMAPSPAKPRGFEPSNNSWPCYCRRGRRQKRKGGRIEFEKPT